MKALYIKGGKLAFKMDFTLPKLRIGDALIKVRLAGICSTDLELVKGYVDFEGIPGHEFVGEVIKVKNKNDSNWIGKRVVGNINLGCGFCEYCKIGIKEHCLNGKALGIRGKNGVFAEFATLPVNNLYEIPNTVSDKQAVFVEPLAAALRITEMVKIPLQKKAAVIGPGRLGLLVSQALSLTGVRLVVVGRNKESLELPKKLGLKIALINTLKEKSFDFVVDTTGNKNGLLSAFKLIKPMGTIVVKSTYNGEININFSKLVVDEISIVGSRCGSFLPAIELLASNKINTEELIDAELTLSNGLEAFEQASKPGVKKILLSP